MEKVAIGYGEGKGTKAKGRNWTCGERKITKIGSKKIEEVAKREREAIGSVIISTIIRQSVESQQYGVNERYSTSAVEENNIANISGATTSTWSERRGGSAESSSPWLAGEERKVSHRAFTKACCQEEQCRSPAGASWCNLKKSRRWQTVELNKNWLFKRQERESQGQLTPDDFKNIRVDE